MPTDGPGPYKVPATSAEWLAAGALTAPNSCWACQEASGSLADSIGSLTLTANASPAYQQTVTGWTRKGVGFNEGTDQRFANSASEPDPSTTSVMIFGYFRFGAASLNGSTMGFNGGGTTSLGVRRRTGDVLQGLDAGSTADDSTTLPGADGLVHPVVFKFNRTGSACAMYTDEAKTTVTYGAGVSTTMFGFGGGTTTNNHAASFNGELLLGALWHGANAELSDAQVKTLLQNLNWTIPWS